MKKKIEGFKYTKKLNKKVIDELLKIQEQKGLTSGNVVENARNPKSPLHNLFEWNNTKAGEKYRKVQAINLIEKVEVVIKGKVYGGFESVKVKIEGDGYQKQYQPTTKILSQKELRTQVLKSALNHLEGWRLKYEMYEEFEGVVKEINKVKEKLK